MGYTLITGASQGLGEEFARQLAAKKKNLILVARSEDKLTRLAQELAGKQSIRVQTIVQDLSRPEAADAVYEYCEKLEWKVDLLRG